MLAHLLSSTHDYNHAKLLTVLDDASIVTCINSSPRVADSWQGLTTRGKTEVIMLHATVSEIDYISHPVNLRSSFPDDANAEISFASFGLPLNVVHELNERYDAIGRISDEDVDAAWANEQERREREPLTIDRVREILAERLPSWMSFAATRSIGRSNGADTEFFNLYVWYADYKTVSHKVVELDLAKLLRETLEAVERFTPEPAVLPAA